jgi:hypothetical protein
MHILQLPWSLECSSLISEVTTAAFQSELGSDHNINLKLFDSSAAGPGAA